MSFHESTLQLSQVKSIRGLTRVNQDLLCEIQSFMDNKDATSMVKTCKGMINTDYLWKSLCERYRMLNFGYSMYKRKTEESWRSFLKRIPTEKCVPIITVTTYDNYCPECDTCIGYFASQCNGCNKEGEVTPVVRDIYLENAEIGKIGIYANLRDQVCLSYGNGPQYRDKHYLLCYNGTIKHSWNTYISWRSYIPLWTNLR
jgi:hypothetical protein